MVQILNSHLNFKAGKWIFNTSVERGIQLDTRTQLDPNGLGYKSPRSPRKPVFHTRINCLPASD